jgi:hypothetical protein
MYKVKKLGSGKEITTSVQSNFRLWLKQNVGIFSGPGAYKDFSSSVFRIIPYLGKEGDDIVVDPFRYKIVKKGCKPVFGNWCYPVTLIDYFGANKLSMFLEYEFGKELSIEEFNRHPYVILRKEILRAVINERLENGSKVNPDWFGAVGKTTLKSKILPKPVKALICRVLVFRYGDESFFSKENGVVLSFPYGWPDNKDCDYALLVLSGSALDAFIYQCEQRKEDAPEMYDEEDLSVAERVYKYPDITDPNTGLFVVFYKASTDPRKLAKAKRASADSDDDLENIVESYQPVNDGTIVPYACFFSKYYPWYYDEEPSPEEIKQSLARSSLSDKSLEKLYATQKEWQDLLRFYSLEEQIEIINANFPADMLNYAFRYEPSYLTSVTKALAKGTVRSFGEPVKKQQVDSFEQEEDEFGVDDSGSMRSILTTAASEIEQLIKSRTGAKLQNEDNDGGSDSDDDILI